MAVRDVVSSLPVSTGGVMRKGLPLCVVVEAKDLDSLQLTNELRGRVDRCSAVGDSPVAAGHARNMVAGA